jgi:TolB-like protein/DNA-binding SARP family transcriptional activator/cytochrome c-type biogenesis protein CcmH/NrfG
MIRLLGTALIEAPEAPLNGRAAQGRRLALLARLALARGRALSRDKLIAELWPEARPERARPLLSDTLYILRSAMGEEVVRPMGDLLVLNTEVVTCDVTLFERALAEGRLEEAVGLYAGPLLDGFFIPGSPEFETWLDGERAALDRQFADTLEKLAVAGERAAAPTVALHWWRRTAAHDPYNGRIALRLMQALEATGDRAGALQHARIHATLLRDQLDAQPDADVAAYAEDLRLKPAPKLPLPSASAEAPGPPAAVSAPEPSRTSGERLPEETAATTSRPAPRADPHSIREGFTPMGLPRRLGAALTFAAVALALAAIITIAEGARRGAATSTARSIAVLPFANVSPDPANTYFSDGLSEQIILVLSRIEGLRVAARTSSFALRDRALGVRAIGDTLGVQAVLEGSVLVDGERLRVIAQLIDARSGFHIWSEQYDGEVRDVLAVQDRIALAIAAALQLRLVGADRPPASRKAPGVEAYDLYLRGLHLREGLSAEGLRQAAEYFDRVIDLEPGFAQALAAKASVVAPLAYFRYAERDSVLAQLRVLTARAVELDPTMGEAYVALGILRLFFDWDWSGAEAAFRRAIELNPNDPHAWHHLANYHSAMGSPHAALAARERAVQLDPLNARTRVVMARDLLVTGDYDRALEQGRRAAQLDPLNPLILGRGPALPAGAAEVLLRQGREEEAVEEYLRLAMLRGASPDELQAMQAARGSAGMSAFWRAWLAMDVRQSGVSPDPFRMAATHLAIGDTAQALDWLERAFRERNPALIYLHRDPQLSGLRAHPRVARIARAMKLPG